MDIPSGPIGKVAQDLEKKPDEPAPRKPVMGPVLPPKMGPFKPLSSEKLGHLLESLDKWGDSEGKRYSHEEWEAPGFSYKYADGKGDEPSKFDPPEPRGGFDALLAPHGKNPVPGIDTEPAEGRGRQHRTGGFDVWGPGGRLPEPENKSGQRYQDEWKPGGTPVNFTPGGSAPPSQAQPAHPSSERPAGPSPVASESGPSRTATSALAARLQQAYPRMSSGECVALAQAMGGVGNVHDWRRGANIRDARPPVGTPVSTFGWHGDSPQYAYGGSGTRGIGRDHAGIVAGYTDKGAWLLNQWRGQAPTYTFYPWEGQGEHGGQNYYTIHSPGQPLGAPGVAPHGVLAGRATKGAGVGLGHRRLPMTRLASRAAPEPSYAAPGEFGASSGEPSAGSSWASGSASSGAPAPLCIKYRSSVVVRVA